MSSAGLPAAAAVAGSMMGSCENGVGHSPQGTLASQKWLSPARSSSTAPGSKPSPSRLSQPESTASSLASKASAPGAPSRLVCWYGSDSLS